MARRFVDLVLVTVATSSSLCQQPGHVCYFHVVQGCLGIFFYFPNVNDLDHAKL